MKVQFRNLTNIPKEVQTILTELEGHNFKAYLVGGCVRDLFLDRTPKDWDITTNALPDEVQKIFPDSVYENDFGTVGVKTRSENPKLALVEITTFRLEEKYSDFRHPDKIKIAKETEKAAKSLSKLLAIIARERVRDEFVKIIMSDKNGPAWGVAMLENLGLLQYIVPELREGIDMGQNKHHIYTVWEHNLRALDYAAQNNYSLEVRLASLLHDVGKPRVKGGDGPDSTFYNHDSVGARMTLKIMDRLKFSRELTEKVAHLVRHHLFYYNVGEVTEAGVRRFLRRVGPENIDDLFKVREADRIGSGVPKAIPYKSRHLQFMIEKVKTDPISPKMLQVDGSRVMEVLKITPGPRVGWILSALLEEVLDNPKKNSREFLEEKIKDLNELKDSELKKISEAAKDKKDEFESGLEEDIKKKYYVRSEER